MMQNIDRLTHACNRWSQCLTVLLFTRRLQCLTYTDQWVGLDHPRASLGTMSQVVQLGKVCLACQPWQQGTIRLQAFE